MTNMNNCILPYCDNLNCLYQYLMYLTCVYDYELYWFYGNHVCIFYCVIFFLFSIFIFISITCLPFMAKRVHR